MLHVNPKGWKDAYRFPKYAYYLWQANFGDSLMAFIQPHYWRSQYVGTRQQIIVDSNGDEVTLKVNGESIGTRRPTAENNHSVTFDSVEIRRGTIVAEARRGTQVATYAVTMAGAPARLVVRTAQPRIPADRSGIAIVSVDVVDSAGVHVYGASPTFTWSVTGPATLVGPAVYRTDTEKKEAMEGTMYIDAPVSNVVRSTATPGTIRVRVSAPGLTSAEVEIASVASADDRVAGIEEPRIDDGGRERVARRTDFKPAVRAAKGSSKNSVAEVKDDLSFRAGAYRAQIDSFVRARNPKLDTSTTAYRAFIERLTAIASERGGHVIADDYNYNARQYGASGGSTAGGIPSGRGAPTRADLRHAIKAALFVPEPPPQLEVERYGERAIAPGVVVERVSYATTYGLRVPAIVYRPAQRPAGKMPGIVVVNGHGGDKSSWYAYYAGILYARAGGVVVTYDPVGELERNAERKSGTRQHDREAEPLPEMGRRMGGQMVTDVMQAVSYLARRADVDSARVAVVGYSMGSFISSLACALDTRINACVLAGGGNLDSVGGYWDTSKKMCQGLPYQALRFLGDRGAVLYDLHAARGRTLVINGTDDAVVAVDKMGTLFFEDLRRRTIALHGSAENVFDYAFVQGAGHRPYFVTRTAALWLNEQLHFPNWTRASIEAMSETHLNEWAARNGLSQEKQYASELSEGGTRALGNDVPAIPRDVLVSLPPERWEQEKARYVYETWVKEATTRATQ